MSANATALPRFNEMNTKVLNVYELKQSLFSTLNS